MYSAKLLLSQWNILICTVAVIFALPTDVNRQMKKVCYIGEETHSFGRECNLFFGEGYFHKNILCAPLFSFYFCISLFI